MFPTFKDQPLVVSLLTALALMAILLMGANAWNALTERKYIGRIPDQRDTITIEGEGKVTAKPTLAELNAGLYTEARDVLAAQQENTQKVNTMTSALRALGIAEADMQTNNYSIGPRYDYGTNKPRIIGYSVSQNLQIKVRDLAKVGTILSRLGELGANQIYAVSFTIDDPSSLKQDARRKALEDARKKADELGKALGVEIVRVVTFTEGGQMPNNPTPFYRAEAMDAATATIAPPVPDIQAGSLDVTSHVSVTYEIR